MAEVEKQLEERVRLRAYKLWEQAGRPEGRSEEFWERARAEVEAEDAGRGDERPNDAPPHSKAAR